MRIGKNTNDDCGCGPGWWNSGVLDITWARDGSAVCRSGVSRRHPAQLLAAPPCHTERRHRDTPALPRALALPVSPCPTSGLRVLTAFVLRRILHPGAQCPGSAARRSASTGGTAVQ